MSSCRHSPQGVSLRASQNYLTASALVNRLADLAGFSPDDHVIEIGPGKGHITRALVRRCARVTAVELDGGLYESLAMKFAGEPALRLHHGDFMAFPLPASGPYKVFSNIPFNRTTAIIRKLTEAANPPRDAWLVVEKGAAKRFMGKPHESLRSLLLKPGFDLEICYHFRREDFHPMPSVDTVLLHLRRKVQPDVAPGEMDAFGRFVEAGMNGGLARLARFMPRRQFISACREAGVPPRANPGDILYIQWLCLYRWYSHGFHT